MKAVKWWIKTHEKEYVTTSGREARRIFHEMVKQGRSPSLYRKMADGSVERWENGAREFFPWP